jgi:hypothetical protein
MVIGLGVAGFAGTLSGNWDLDVCTTDLTTFSVTSILNVDYTLGDWVFGMNSYFTDPGGGLGDLSFDVTGLLGAFSIYSLLDFSGTAFQSWSNAATVSIAGVDLWVIMALEEEAFGYSIGGHGVAGDVEIWVEVDFGLSSSMYYWYTYGFGYLVDWEPYYSCVYGWTNGAFGLAQTNDCDPAFSGVDIWVEAPFCCLDVLAKLSFDCDGFVEFCVELNDIDLGAGWFQLDDFNICFTEQTKSISGVDFTLTLGDAVCVTPYFDVSMDGTYIVDGIALHALLLECEFNGVTFKAGELLLKTKYIGFTPTGGLWSASYWKYTDCYIVGAEEYFAVEIDGDSCCGGAFDASFFVFFDIDTWGDGIFDWMLFLADVTVGIGPNIDISFGLDTVPGGIQELCIGFDYSF